MYLPQLYPVVRLLLRSGQCTAPTPAGRGQCNPAGPSGRPTGWPAGATSVYSILPPNTAEFPGWYHAQTMNSILPCCCHPPPRTRADSCGVVRAAGPGGAFVADRWPAA